MPRGDQVLGAVDIGEPRAGLVALILTGALPCRLISEEDACLCIPEGARLGVVDGAPALAERGFCMGGAGPLRGRSIGAARTVHGRCSTVARNARAGMVARNWRGRMLRWFMGRRTVRRKPWATPSVGHAGVPASGTILGASAFAATTSRRPRKPSEQAAQLGTAGGIRPRALPWK